LSDGGGSALSDEVIRAIGLGLRAQTSAHPVGAGPYVGDEVKAPFLVTQADYEQATKVYTAAPRASLAQPPGYFQGIVTGINKGGTVNVGFPDGDICK